MNGLIQLITIIEPDLSSSFEGNLRVLYIAIRNNKLTTEEEGMNLFFKGNRHQKKYFNKLKNDLKKILRNHLLNTPSLNLSSQAAKKIVECYKVVAEVKLLIKFNAIEEAANIAKQCLVQALSYNLHKVAFILAEDLQFIEALINKQFSEAEVYDEIAKKQLELSQIENQVQTYFAIIGGQLNSTRSSPNDFQEEINCYALKVQQYLNLNSTSINIYVYNILIVRHYTHYDYSKIIEVCKEANNFFLNSKYPEKRYSFLYKIVPPLIVLKRYLEARNNINDAIELSNIGTINWSICNYYSLVLYFYEQNYQQAYQVYHSVKKYGDKIYQGLGEDWLILKAYLSFFIKTKHIQTQQVEHFKLSKFLNELPEASKDKSGNNINIVIVQILHLLLNNKGALIDQTEAFEKYIRRHLKDPTLVRAKLFLMMLLRIPKNHFHKTAVLRKTQKLQQQLADTPIKMRQNLSIEIVPYEVLWEIVLDQLENKFVGNKKKRR